MTNRHHGLHAVENTTTPEEQRAKVRAAWRPYRLRRSLAFVLLFGWVPAAVGLFLMSRLWLHEPVLSLSLILLWLIAACVAIWWAGEFRCPRCRRRYGAIGSKSGIGVIWRGLFDKICHNCKLRKFEEFTAEGSNPGILDRRAVKN